MTQEKSIRKTFSIIGFALCALMILRDGVGICMSLLYLHLVKAASSPVRDWLVEVFQSSWYDVAGSSILGYAATIPVFLWILKSVPGGYPEDIRVKKKLRISKLLSLYVISMGLGYLFNFMGVFINLLIALVKGGSFSALNPIGEVMNSLSPVTGFYIGVIAPVIEEFIFRGVIVGKTKKYGESTAIIFSAVLFGLLHGNIAQTLYATFIGLILGYVAVKTGGIFYSCILHIMINSYSTVLAFLSQHFLLSGSSPLMEMVFSFLILLLTLMFFILAIIFLCLNWKRTSYQEGELLSLIGRGRMWRLAWCNGGVILFTLLCIGMMAYYIIVS